MLVLGRMGGAPGASWVRVGRGRHGALGVARGDGAKNGQDGEHGAEETARRSTAGAKWSHWAEV